MLGAEGGAWHGGFKEGRMGGGSRRGLGGGAHREGRVGGGSKWGELGWWWGGIQVGRFGVLGGGGHNFPYLPLPFL